MKLVISEGDGVISDNKGNYDSLDIIGKIQM